MPRILSFAIACQLLAAAPAFAQNRTTGLASLFQEIFGPTGLVVNSEQVLPDGSTHSAHFNSGFQSEFTQFNVALASQLTAVPLPSPAPVPGPVPVPPPLPWAVPAYSVPSVPS